MHIPVLLAGFLVGPISGLVVGLLAPVLSHLLTGMPPSYAVPLMTLELPVYGLVAGLAYRRLKLNLYVSLLAAMILGRIVFGLALLILGRFVDLPYTAAAYFSIGGALWAGLPGIVLQLVLVPVIVAGVQRRKRP
jgi:riboflavin transporter FmnP